MCCWLLAGKKNSFHSLSPSTVCFDCFFLFFFHREKFNAFSMESKYLCGARLLWNWHLPRWNVTESWLLEIYSSLRKAHHPILFAALFLIILNSLFHHSYINIQYRLLYRLCRCSIFLRWTKTYIYWICVIIPYIFTKVRYWKHIECIANEIITSVALNAHRLVYTCFYVGYTLNWNCD